MMRACVWRRRMADVGRMVDVVVALLGSVGGCKGEVDVCDSVDGAVRHRAAVGVGADATTRARRPRDCGLSCRWAGNVRGLARFGDRRAVRARHDRSRSQRDRSALRRRLSHPRPASVPPTPRRRARGTGACGAVVLRRPDAMGAGDPRRRRPGAVPDPNTRPCSSSGGCRGRRRVRPGGGVGRTHRIFELVADAGVGARGVPHLDSTATSSAPSSSKRGCAADGTTH